MAFKFRNCYTMSKRASEEEPAACQRQRVDFAAASFTETGEAAVGLTKAETGEVTVDVTAEAVLDGGGGRG